MILWHRDWYERFDSGDIGAQLRHIRAEAKERRAREARYAAMTPEERAAAEAEAADERLGNFIDRIGDEA